jgi:hypothetical protein
MGRSPAMQFVKAVGEQTMEVESEEWKGFSASAKRCLAVDIWIVDAIRADQLPTWLMFLVTSTQIVQVFYEPDATIADPYQANFFLSSVIRFLKSYPASSI